MPNDERPIYEAKTVNETFSDYVASLTTSGDPPDAASYEAVREELRAVLVRELRRRGLWRAPPSHVGYSGSDWSQGALDELVSDAYTFIFLRRLKSLRDQQKVKGNIRPLVRLNVRHFLTELQKKADPLGYRLFTRLRRAVETVVERGKLFLLDAKKPRFWNDAVLAFQPRLAALSPRHDLEAPVRRWNDDLLPDLVTAEGPAVPKVVDQVADKVLSLKEDDGVDAFRFGDLVSELKDDVRRRWESLWHGTLGETAIESGGPDGGPVPVHVVRPEEEPDWPRRLVLIQDCVATSIDKTRPDKKRRDLWSLWNLVRATRLPSARLPSAEDGALPPLAELGRQLKLTRDRVRQLFTLLEPIVRDCLRTAGRIPAPMTPTHEESSDDPVKVARQGRR